MGFHRDDIARQSDAIPSSTARAVVDSGPVTGLPEYDDHDDLRQNAQVTPAGEQRDAWTFEEGAEIPLDVAARQWDEHGEQIALYDESGQRVDDGDSGADTATVERYNSWPGDWQPATPTMTDGGQRANASDSGSDSDSDSEDIEPSISTWGDVRGLMPAVDLPDGVDESDSIGKDQWNDWIEGTIAQIDADDHETLRALPDDVSPSENLRLVGQYAARGDGEGAPPMTDGGERDNAQSPSWIAKNGGTFGDKAPPWLADDTRQNANVEDVPTGGDPFADRADSEAQADRSPMRTDGPMRTNAGDTGPDVPSGSSPFAEPDEKSSERTNAFGRESTTDALGRVSDSATSIYRRLEEEPATQTELINGQNPSRVEVKKALDELRHADLVEKRKGSDPPVFESAATDE